MKKCPKCGNPSYDGAPVCGNCGYNFPKPKTTVPRSEDIFLQEPKKEKTSNNEDTLTIIKENKVVIGIILIVTIIIICGIVLAGMNNSNSTLNNDDLIEYNANNFSFKYPKSWKVLNSSDVNYAGAKFFQNENNVTIEFYNTTGTDVSLKLVAQDIIDYAQNNAAYVELVETIQLDGSNSSNIIIENPDGNFTRFVSMFNNDQIFVFKITGKNIDLLESEDINATLMTADIP